MDGGDLLSTWGDAKACHSRGTNPDVTTVYSGDHVPMPGLPEQLAQLWERTVSYSVLYHISYI